MVFAYLGEGKQRNAPGHLSAANVLREQQTRGCSRGWLLAEPRKDLIEVFARASSGSVLVQAARTLTFFLQNLPAFPAGSPASQGQRRVTLVTTVGADPFGVTLVTAVGANMREEQEANSGTLPPCTHKGPPAPWVSSSSTSAAPCNMRPPSHG